MGKKKSKNNNPSFSEEDRQKYNYSVLGRHDPRIYQIFFTSSICNVYKYDLEENQWEKLNCQGTLFIYSRVARDPNDIGDTQKYPYALMVLNRLSIENFTLGITPLSLAKEFNDGSEMDINMEDPFIMVQSSDEQMYGLWLFHDQDRERTLTTLQWCLNADTSGQQKEESLNTANTDNTTYVES